MSQIENTIRSVNLRFGSHALGRAIQVPPPLPWPVGIEAVERMTGIGGLPRGRISILEGAATSGKLSLALALLARASAEMARAVLIDPGLGLDPWMLLPHSPHLARITLIRPPRPEAGFEAAITLARAGAGFLLLLAARPGASGRDQGLPLSQLERAAHASGTVITLVCERAGPEARHASSFSLELQRQSWLHQRGELVGIRSRVSCLKTRLGRPAPAATLDFLYPLSPLLFPDGHPISEPGDPSTENPGAGSWRPEGPDEQLACSAAG